LPLPGGLIPDLRKDSGFGLNDCGGDSAALPQVGKSTCRPPRAATLPNAVAFCAMLRKTQGGREAVRWLIL
jgi:hypothetical protein